MSLGNGNQKKMPDTYYIAPSLTMENEHFLFCPNGDEIHFKLRSNGIIEPLNRTVLWRKERKFIKNYFGI